jgi:xanthine dehydrogenase accessory factor
MSVLTRVDTLRTGRTPFVLATVVRAERPTSAKPGDRALVLPDGTMEGFVGGECAESTVRSHGLRLLASGESTLLRITPAASSETVSEGLVTVGNPCLSGGTLEIFLEAVFPPRLVHVHGDGPVARALVAVGRASGHDVEMAGEEVPDDLAALLVASHGHDEKPLLEKALRAGVPYVGLVASRRRGTAVLASLDVTQDQRARVHTPAGLDIGARTPAEIALSIYAQLVATHVGDKAGRAAVQPVEPAEDGPCCH